MGERGWAYAEICGGGAGADGAVVRRGVSGGGRTGGRAGACRAGDGCGASRPGRDADHTGRGYDGADDAGTLSHRRGAGRDARLLRDGGAAGTGGGRAQLCVLPAGGGAQGRPPGRGLLHRPHLLQRLPVRDGGQGEVGRRLRPVEYTGGAGGQRHGRAGGAVQRAAHSGGIPLLLRRAHSRRRGRVERRPALSCQRGQSGGGRRRCPTITAP